MSSSQHRRCFVGTVTITSSTVLIDDVRRFRDGRPCVVARTSAAGLAVLDELCESRIDDLWLDHDLGGEDTIWPIIRLLEDAHLRGRPSTSGRCTSTRRALSRRTRWASACGGLSTRRCGPTAGGCGCGERLESQGVDRSWRGANLDTDTNGRSVRKR